ncbi:MAG: UDP-N-acetylmuramoyl-L-alanyl-D-glutamate--2,6-diaminopimelate ligase [Holosporaceae bacterium]|jgi:UDP-N-acetylmuramoyl-L-alanyl-D-glutamate--2,6-diaminopimelate ligase|nr:UDP-N-acetylmuramoyl-L-alanyl-D-glutamate--2,6-diaminopimelate ligase [Holosporaceae bacterium]
MKKLGELVSFSLPNSLKRLTITDICDNSQKVIAGSVFVALKGASVDGKAYVDDAILKGARCVVLDGENFAYGVEIRNDIPFVFVRNARAELAHMLGKFFDGNFDGLAAVTGTNGKSSTVDMVRQIWTGAGITGASIGTLGVISEKNNENLSANLTSPGAIELRKILNKLQERKIKNIVLEASSHGLDQSRIDGLKFDVCAFTNFSRDHLDYHQTLENYWRAKERLFSEIALQKTVIVVNSDDKYSARICEIAKNRRMKCISYGYEANDIRIVEIKQEETHQKVKALFWGKEISFVFPISGTFQVYNALCAAAICHFTGLKLDAIVDGLTKLHPINGRLELISQVGTASIYLDYAHTPDALKNAILSLRNCAKNRIIVVFGCGGNRDASKRVLMGEIAREFADIVIVTDDNPRNENPEQIRKMILKGCPVAKEIADRKNAIEYAIDMLSYGDALLVAGKGHENYQQIGDEFTDFSDRDIILSKVFP